MEDVDHVVNVRFGKVEGEDRTGKIRMAVVIVLGAGQDRGDWSMLAQVRLRDYVSRRDPLSDSGTYHKGHISCRANHASSLRTSSPLHPSRPSGHPPLLPSPFPEPSNPPGTHPSQPRLAVSSTGGSSTACLLRSNGSLATGTCVSPKTSRVDHVDSRYSGPRLVVPQAC